MVGVLAGFGGNGGWKRKRSVPPERQVVISAEGDVFLKFPDGSRKNIPIDRTVALVLAAGLRGNHSSVMDALERIANRSDQ